MSTILNLSKLTKCYANGVTALRGIDLQVTAGDFFALLGPNGAGKSTALDIICSLVNKTSGTVTVNGFDLLQQREQAKRSLGVVPQEFNFNNFEKVIDIVTQQAGYYGLPLKLAKARAEKYLQQLELWDKRDEQAQRLSGGMKRRLMIARALVHEPKILILDEPTAGVDIEIRRSMWGFLRQLNAKGTTIILTTHYLEEAEALCNNMAIIGRGEIIAKGSTQDLLKDRDRASFIADLDQSPNALIEDFADVGGKLRQDGSIEFYLSRGQRLNDAMAIFNKQHLAVIGVRPKTNRLEELFIELTGKQED